MFTKRTGVLAFIAVALGLFHYVTYSDGLAVMSVDLGSQFIKIAIVKPGVPMEIALNKESRRKTPVVVSMRNNERLFGDAALVAAVKYPKSAYIYLNDIIGKRFDSPSVQNYRQRFPWYNLIKDEERGTVLFKHDENTVYSPEELLGMILNNSRVIAQDYADHPIKDIVITVPAYYRQAERRTVLRAAELVGLNVLQLMNDNAAVALNYGVFRRNSFNDTEKYIMFYDVGASSTVATVVAYSTVKTRERGISETVPQLSIRGVGFDRSLGGHAMEMRLRDHLVKLFKKTHKTKDDVTKSPRAMAKFHKEALRLKQVLSANTDHFAQIEGVFEDQDFRAKVTRAEFEEMIDDILKRVPGPVEEALKAAHMRMKHIDSVILVGGGTRVPKLQEVLLKAVQKDELAKNLNADEAAALGAVYQAAHLGKGFRVKKFLVKDTNIYPIEVTFDRVNKAEDGSETVKTIKRTLYHRMNVVPQKKVMTFNRHTDDFKFHVGYTELDFLSDTEKSEFGPLNLTTVTVKGVSAALEKHTPNGETKGIKAYFRMDESGLLNIEKIESVFEKMPEEKEEQSTFAKLGSKISSFFSGSKEDSKEEKKEEGKEDEEAKSDKKEDEVKDEKKEGEAGGKKTEKKKEDTVKDEKQNKEGQKKEEEQQQKKEETKKDKEEEKKEEKKEDEKKSDESKDGEKKKGEDKESKDDKKKKEEKKPPKPVTVREPLGVDTEVLDIPHVTETSITQSRKKLAELQARDEAKIANERAKNSLESHIFNMKDALYGEIGELLSTEEEREKINKALSEAADWLDEDGWDSTADVYDAKLSKLREQSFDFRQRLREHKARPKALETIRSSLNLSTTFMKQIMNLTDKDEIYTAKDLQEMENINKETQEWLEKMEKKQNESKPYENPVLLVKDIEMKQGKVDRELLYLLNKAKYYVPKPKVNDTAGASNKTENATKTNGDSSKKDKKAESEETKKKETKSKREKEELPTKDQEDDKKTSEKSEEKKSEAEQPAGKSGEKPLPLPGGETTETPADKVEEKDKTSNEDEKRKSEL